MCNGCKQLADREAFLVAKGARVAHVEHVKETGPHCDAPLTCTCQHKPIGSYRPKESGS